MGYEGDFGRDFFFGVFIAGLTLCRTSDEHWQPMNPTPPIAKRKRTTPPSHHRKPAKLELALAAVPEPPASLSEAARTEWARILPALILLGEVYRGSAIINKWRNQQSSGEHLSCSPTARATRSGRVRSSSS